MDEQFDYSAFISYKREDEKWAVWLQNHLERYSIPTTIRKEIPRLPKRIKPVFRDKTDLGAGGLSSSLHKELERSHYLIVICSPNSAKSNWVGKEIDYFKQLGREKNIIPFVVDGIPHSNDSEKECFHPIFNEFEDEPLLINVNEIGKQQALIKVLAQLLDLRFDQLWRRHTQYERKKKIRIGISLFIFVLLGLFYWYINKPMYKYYADYVDQWGIPFGILELEKSSYEHRNRSYRFEYRRVPLGEKDFFSWRLSKVEYVNSSGIPQNFNESEHENRFPIQKFEYNPNSNSIKNIDFCNRYGKTIVRWKISSNGESKASLADFLGVTDLDASSYLNSVTTLQLPYDNITSNTKSSIKRYFFTRDSLGHITSISYHSNNADDVSKSKTTDKNGIHKLLFTNDELGRVITTTYYDCDDNVVHRKDGVAIRKYGYDKCGNISDISFYNSEEVPVLNKDSYHRVKKDADKYGNVIKESFYGTDGQRCYNAQYYSLGLIEYDSNGNPISVTFLDLHNHRCTNKDGVSKINISCDDRGNQIDTWYENLSGKSCRCKYGWARVKVDYNRKCHQTHISYFDTNGDLIKTTNGIAGWNNKYDRNGNCIEGEFFDIDYNVCVDNNGVSKWIAEFDERGYQTSLICFDIEGNRVNTKSGWAIQKYKYDDRGNLSEISFFDSNDLPILIDLGYHLEKREYDEYGNIIGCSYYNQNGHLAQYKEKYAYYKALPDSLGNIVRYEHYDENGNLTKNREGVVIANLEYDEYGHVICTKFYDQHNSPDFNGAGIHGWKAKYDSFGNQVEYLGFDQNGKLRGDTTGIAKWEKKFDLRGNQISYEAFGEDNMLKEHSNGIAGWEARFNDRGQQIELTYYNRSKKQCINPDVGYSIFRAGFNDKGDYIEISTYNEKGELLLDPSTGYALWKAEYDENGNRTLMLSYNEKNELCVCKHGYAKYVAKFDSEGEFVEDYNYDEKGNIINKKNNLKEQKEPNDIRKYDSHRFKYDLADIIFGTLFFIVLIIAFIVWINKSIHQNAVENLFCIVGIITWSAFVYIYMRKVLLHFGLIPYNLYNYSWLLIAFGALVCAIVCLTMIGYISSKIISIFKNPKYLRKSKLKENKGEIIGFLVGATYLAFLVYYFIDEGLNVYNNPL
ncbi:MAG: TIR domain-containing protein [Paraprevotella sp.]|nr:TIR domain-containing protein [Paraprevotella sp.]